MYELYEFVLSSNSTTHPINSTTSSSMVVVESQSQTSTNAILIVAAYVTFYQESPSRSTTNSRLSLKPLPSSNTFTRTSPAPTTPTI